jgi:hypothetical protein
MGIDIEAAIAREQERLARLLELARAGEIARAPGRESIPDLLAQITATIDEIEVAVGVANASRATRS